MHDVFINLDRQSPINNKNYLNYSPIYGICIFGKYPKLIRKMLCLAEKKFTTIRCVFHLPIIVAIYDFH